MYIEADDFIIARACDNKFACGVRSPRTWIIYLRGRYDWKRSIERNFLKNLANVQLWQIVTSERGTNDR